jgi:hypothetical protein
METPPPDYGVIGVTYWTGEGFAEPEAVGGGVHSNAPDAHPFIAPDESFLVFDSYREGSGGFGGIYVCFRSADGTWGDAILLNGLLGIPPFAGQPALSPDGRYLFYSLHWDMYWVSAGILEELRPR